MLSLRDYEDMTATCTPYQHSFDRYFDTIYDEATSLIKNFIVSNDYFGFCQKLEKGLKVGESWAEYTADEIGLNRKHIAALIGDCDLLEDLATEENFDRDHD